MSICYESNKKSLSYRLSFRDIPRKHIFATVISQIFLDPISVSSFSFSRHFEKTSKKKVLLEAFKLVISIFHVHIRIRPEDNYFALLSR